MLSVFHTPLAIQLVLCTQIACATRCMLYSMDVWVHGTDLWVAAGTVFLDVLVWQATCASDMATQALNGDAVHAVVPLHVLKGHEGSIHRYDRGEEKEKKRSAVALVFFVCTLCR